MGDGEAGDDEAGDDGDGNNVDGSIVACPGAFRRAGVCVGRPMSDSTPFQPPRGVPSPTSAICCWNAHFLY